MNWNEKENLQKRNAAENAERNLIKEVLYITFPILKPAKKTKVIPRIKDIIITIYSGHYKNSLSRFVTLICLQKMYSVLQLMPSAAVLLSLL
jgi:hypothetical protein